jgi:hypothetical protein
VVDLAGDEGEVVGPRRLHGESWPVGGAMEYAVDDERVDVKVEIEGCPAAVDRGDGPTACRAIVRMGAKSGKDGAHEGPHDGGLASGITRELEALR